jgi:hypothetical protein
MGGFEQPSESENTSIGSPSEHLYKSAVARPAAAGQEPVGPPTLKPPPTEPVNPPPIEPVNPPPTLGSRSFRPFAPPAELHQFHIPVFEPGYSQGNPSFQLPALTLGGSSEDCCTQPADAKPYDATAYTDFTRNSDGVNNLTIGKWFTPHDYANASLSFSDSNLGETRLTLGHSIFTPYKEDGTLRNYSLNLEAGGFLPTGKTFEHGQLPFDGSAGVVLGANGYYNFDKKTSAYGSFDWSHSGSFHSEWDAQAGLTRKVFDIPLSVGYQRSEVSGYKGADYLQLGASLPLSRNVDLFVNGTIPLERKNSEGNVAWFGLNFRW